MEKLYEVFDSSEADALTALEKLKSAGLPEEYKVLKRHLWNATTLINNQLLTIESKNKKIHSLTGEETIEGQATLFISNAQGRKARATQIKRRRQESRGGQKKGRDGQNTKQIAKRQLREWLKETPSLSQGKAAQMLVNDSIENRDKYGRTISDTSGRNYYREVKSEGV
jgi:hypothetical protein